MTDTPPDRLSVSTRSPHFDESVLTRGVGVRFRGKVRRDVEEYCVSGGWIRVAAGKSLDRFGNPITLKHSGPVEVWFLDEGDSASANEEG